MAYDETITKTAKNCNCQDIAAEKASVTDRN